MLEPLAESLAITFVQRQDLYARQLDDGRYICIHKPLESWHLVNHLEGKITLGTYILDQDSQARYIVFDADDHQQAVSLRSLTQLLLGEEIPSYLESSRRGCHLWFFFDQPVTGQDARIFGKGLLTNYDLKGIELFPKQDKLSQGPGSLIRLPFGVHRRDGRRYDFINFDGKSLTAITI